VSDDLTPGGGRHHFFDATSLSMALSSIASASNLRGYVRDAELFKDHAGAGLL
jgi:hypothetical protein